MGAGTMGIECPTRGRPGRGRRDEQGMARQARAGEEDQRLWTRPRIRGCRIPSGNGCRSWIRWPASCSAPCPRVRASRCAGKRPTAGWSRPTAATCRCPCVIPRMRLSVAWSGASPIPIASVWHGPPGTARPSLSPRCCRNRWPSSRWTPGRAWPSASSSHTSPPPGHMRAPSSWRSPSACSRRCTRSPTCRARTWKCPRCCAASMPSSAG